MRRIIQVLLALALAYGWLWTSWLEKQAMVSAKAVPWVLALMGILFLIQQIWISAPPKPRARTAVEEQREIAQTCLDTVLARYGEPLFTCSC